MRPRLPGLEVLRAMAIIWVLFFHAGTMSLGSPLPAVTGLGWMGVDLFFLLSGFLICRQWLSMVERSPRTPFGEFYRRRALRILPAYLVVVAMYFLVPGTQERAAIQPLWQFLTFTENLFINSYRAKTFSHVWSLCVEEHFYLVFPLLAWALLRRPSTFATITVCVLIAVGGAAFRAHEWFDAVAPQAGVDGPGNMSERYQERIYYPTLPRLDGLLMGVVLALIEARRAQAWAFAMNHAVVVFLLGCGALAGAVLLDQHKFTAVSAILMYPALAIAMGCFVAAGASLERVRIPGAAFVAAISYSLYLSHKMAFHLAHAWVGKSLDDHGGVAIVVYAAAALALGLALYFGVERPFLKLRDTSPLPVLGTARP